MDARTQPGTGRGALTIFCALVMAAGMWFYVAGILIPYQIADARLHDRPRGNLSDLYPRWLGARELWLHGRNPYSAEVTREIQAGYYGRPLDPTKPTDPRDQMGFVYPPYVTFLLVPTFHLSFETVRVIFTWMLVALTAISVVGWFRILGWTPGMPSVIAAVILTLGSFAGMQGAYLQQLSLLVSALIAACLLMLGRGWLWSAGVLLGVAAIKPQVVGPIAGFLLLWSVSAWRERQRFAWGLFLCVAALFAGAHVLLPGWFHDWIIALRQYKHYTGEYMGGQSRLDVLLGQELGGIVALVFILAAAAVGFKSRRAAVTSHEFQFAAALILGTTAVIIPNFAPYNELLLLPAILMIVRAWASDLYTRPFRIGAAVAFAFLAWQWLAAFGLSVASFFLAPEVVQRGWAVPLWAEFAAAPALLLTLAGLYIQPSKVAVPVRGCPA